MYGLYLHSEKFPFQNEQVCTFNNLFPNSVMDMDLSATSSRYSHHASVLSNDDRLQLKTLLFACHYTFTSLLFVLINEAITLEKTPNLMHID